MDDGTESLTTHLDGATSVLLVAPPAEPPDDHACIDLLTFGDPGRDNVLSVTFSQAPDERLAVWRREVGEPLPNRAVVVDGSGAAIEGRRTASSDDLAELSVDVLSETAGPMELALVVGQYLGEWSDAPERTFACVHSLSDLLESFDRCEVVQLINALDARLESADAVVHYHLDPDAHDERTVSEIRPLFDTVVEHVPGHGWTVTATPSDDAPTFRGDSSALYAGTSAAVLPPLDRSLDEVLDLLSDSRRRGALRAVHDYGDGPVPVETIADAVVEREADRGDRTAPSIRREVRVALAHYHLPKLDEAGVIEYDHDAKEVSKRDLGSELEALVEFVDRIERS